MFKKDKTLFITIILMLIIIISIIFVVVIFEKKNDEFLNQEKYVSSLEDSKDKLEDTVEDLRNEIDEINRENKKNIISQEGDMATYYQSMIDLSDISLMIKEGKIEEARKELQKINPSGFDFTALSFYESLCRELNIEN